MIKDVVYKLRSPRLAKNVKKRKYIYGHFTFIYWGFAPDLIWLRIGKPGFGFAARRKYLPFSQRNGFVKTYPIGFGWRLQILKKAI